MRVYTPFLYSGGRTATSTAIRKARAAIPLHLNETPRCADLLGHIDAEVDVDLVGCVAAKQ